MAGKSGVFISTNRFGDIAKALPDETALVVGKTTFDLEGQIIDNINAVDAVDTGTMVNTVKGHHEPGDLEGTVTTNASTEDGFPYWEAVNYGTHKMAARPFLEPAIETVKPGFEAAINELFERM